MLAALVFFIIAFFTLCNTSYAALVPKPPAVNASSYILIDANSGMTIVEENADLVLPPASLTKIMTSYIAEYEIEQGNVSKEDLVPISVKAWRKGGSKMYIQEGTRVKLIDLLRGIIVQSGNDASIAVAEFIAGSEESFADLMNQHAKRLGMKNTHFVNATGWPAETHRTTARDLAILSRALINDFPQHYSIYSEKSFTYNDITQPNRNTLLGANNMVDGIKTGHTEEAGYCLVASGQDDQGMRLISVVTGTSSTKARSRESQKLLTYGFRFFDSVEVAPANTPLQSPKVWKGSVSQVNIGIAKPLQVTIPRGQAQTLKLNYELPAILSAPITQGQQLGQLKVILEDKTIASTPLIAQNAVKPAGFFVRVWHSIMLFFKGLFG